MNRVMVTDMGLVTALGQGLETNWQALLAGRSGLAPVQRFDTSAYVTNLAGCIAELDAEAPHSRLDSLVDLLLQDVSVPADCSLLTASTKAGIDLLERHLRQHPTATDRLLGHQVAAHVAQVLGIKGSRQNISAACASATMALAMGAAQIACGQAEAVMVCGLDIVSEFIFSGFSALKALSPAGCRPFDAERDGLNQGEGAAYVLLMSEARRVKDNRPCHGEILGWGISGDANHITAPSRVAEGLIRAVDQSLTVAGLKTGDMAAFSAHGTGSIYNDAMELTACEALFEKPRPLHSVKGATGHTMGASGAIETILGLKSLQTHLIPPTVGLEIPDPRAVGWVSNQAQALQGDYLLTTNSGFGGINAALVLGRGEAS